MTTVNTTSQSATTQSAPTAGDKAIQTTPAAQVAARTHENRERASESWQKSGEVIYRPPMNLYEFDDRYEIQFDIPGASPEHIEVTVNDAVLTVEAHVPQRHSEGATPLRMEYGIGDYRRQVRLGEDVSSDDLSARYTDGVLRLTLPKLQERRRRKIPISGA